MDYVRVKRLFYTFAFLDDFVLIYPLYALLFAHHGLGAAQISSLYIVWSLTAFPFEVPAGVLADKYSRRSVLMVAVLIKALAFSCWLAYPHYVGFLSGFVLWGLSGSLVSGTEEALVYDELKRAGKSSEYTRVTGTMGGLRMLGIVVASFAVSPLAGLGYPAILAISVAIISSSIIPIWQLPRAPQVGGVAEVHYLAHLRQGFQLVRRNRKLLFIMAYAAIVTGLTADEYYSLFFREQGFSVSVIAVLLGVISLFGMIGNLLAHRLERKQLPLRIMLFISALLLLTATLVPKQFIVIFLSMIDIYTFATAVLCNSYLQHELSDSHRATATSVSALAVELGGLLTFGIFAVASQLRTYTFGMQVLAATIGMFAIVYGALSRRYETPL